MPAFDVEFLISGEEITVTIDDADDKEEAISEAKQMLIESINKLEERFITVYDEDGEEVN